MWCPSCNRQYEEEFETCLICGGKLEAYTPILSDHEREVLELNDETNIVEQAAEDAPPAEIMPELLVSVVGEEEARRLAALLEGVRIPCLCRPAKEDEVEEMFEEFEQETEVDLVDDLEPEGTEPTTAEEDTAIYDLLIPKMMFPKALRILNEDSIRREETLLEEGDLPEFEGENEESEEPEGDDQTVSDEKTEKKRKGLFGFFGKKR